MIYISDIDGTVANTEHRKHFLESSKKDWDGWNNAMISDIPKQSIIQLLQTITVHIPIVLCTGRQESYRVVTEEWLGTHGVPHIALYMRVTGDYRCDTIVKFEMADMIELKYGPITMVLDDRNKVVDMWRKRGLTCLQVAPGDF